MARVLVQASLPFDTGLPSDVSINTWAFDTGGLGTTTPALTSIVSGLSAFYDEVTPLYSELMGGDITFKAYDLADPEPRAPVGTIVSPWPGGAGSNPLPEEVAFCLSFQAVEASGSPMARRRGRVYLGPFGTTAAGETAGRSAPDAAVGLACQAGIEAAHTIWDTGETPHCVWSRVDDVFRPVVSYFYDNAWDTQRRRGPRPTSRTTFSVL